MSDSYRRSESMSSATTRMDCTGTLVVNNGFDWNQIGITFAKTHSRPKDFLPYSVKLTFLKSEDVIELLLILEVPLTQYPEADYLFCYHCVVLSCPEACLFFRDDCLCLGLQLV